MPEVPLIVDNATYFCELASSLIAGIPIFAHYAKYADTINKEFKLYGISKWKTSVQLSNVKLKMTAFDAFLIGIDVVIDMYDSYQRGVSAGGILLGGVLTAVSKIALLYLDKGIMWATTLIGTAIYPGLGTAIGFIVGLGASIFINWWLGNLISDLIDSKAK